MNLEFGLFPQKIPMPWDFEEVEKVKKFIPERQCFHCGKTFQPLEKRTRCCSVSCGVRYSAAVRAGRARGYTLPDLPDRKCKACNTPFVPRNGMQRYCCDGCYRKAKSERAKQGNQKGMKNATEL